MAELKVRIELQKRGPRLVNVVVTITEGTSAVDDEVLFIHNGKPIGRVRTTDGIATMEFADLLDGRHFFEGRLGNNASKSAQKDIIIGEPKDPKMQTNGAAKLTHRQAGRDKVLFTLVGRDGKPAPNVKIFLRDLNAPAATTPYECETDANGLAGIQITTTGTQFIATAPSLGIADYIFTIRVPR